MCAHRHGKVARRREAMGIGVHFMHGYDMVEITFVRYQNTLCKGNLPCIYRSR